MDDNKVSISLTLDAPAKIGGRYFKAGETVLVGGTVASHLGATVFDTSDTPVASDFDAAVAAAAKTLAEAGIAAAVQLAVSDIAKERDDAVAALATMKTALDDANAKVAAATDNEQDAAGKIATLRERVAELETALAQTPKPADGETATQKTTTTKPKK